MDGRPELLLDQFDHAREMVEMRLTGLGDQESWSVRRWGEAVTPRAYGPGEWVLDLGAPDIPAGEYAEVARQAASGMTVAKIADDWSVSAERVEEVLAHTGPPRPTATPVTTIAWRLGHLHSCFAAAARRPAAGRLHPRAAEALDRFWATIDRWRDSLTTVTDPFVDVVSGANLEFIHRMAEIALLRDLWRARS